MLCKTAGVIDHSGCAGVFLSVSLTPVRGHQKDRYNSIAYNQWCPEPESNRYDRFGSADFKSAVSTNFTTRAPFDILRHLGEDVLPGVNTPKNNLKLVLDQIPGA